jgi:hypothetical protein
MTTQKEFVGRIARMTPDGECVKHGPSCVGISSTCELFVMKNEDAIETLKDLILCARLHRKSDS